MTYQFRPFCFKCRRRVDEYLEENNRYYCLKCKPPSQRKKKPTIDVKGLDVEYKRQLALANKPYKR